VKDWHGRRAVVLGLARQGKALARYLNAQGAEVVVSDVKPAEALQSELEELSDLSLSYELSGHPLGMLEGTDTLFLSGGVPADLEIVAHARELGIRIANDAQLFLERTPARVVGITGSAGKTTTTSLVAEMANLGFEASDKQVWLGGNIGFPLISSIDEMGSEDLAVMELSSFQLEIMTCSPPVAALLNLAPDHLDRHGDMQSYRAAKARILEFQSHQDIAVLNCSDPLTWELQPMVKGRLFAFGLDLAAGFQGGYIEAGELKLRIEDEEIHVCSQDEIALPGQHNQMNVLAAALLSAIVGVPFEAIRQIARTFRGVPHRLEHVRSVAGADWYNDSIATTPDRAIAAIQAFHKPLVLLAGGRDKDLDWDRFAEIVHQQVRVIILFGEAAGKIEQALIKNRISESQLVIKKAETLESAVAKAKSSVEAGDVVLLSPGGTSFDEFVNYEARGEEFRRMVREI
jgi:UDP-N-acetylmuramoylalanine--D-glutamate ligase